jgi:hypothetical protein
MAAGDIKHGDLGVDAGRLERWIRQQKGKYALDAQRTDAARVRPCAPVERRHSHPRG